MPHARIRHYSLVDRRAWPARHFSPKEVACRHCGEVVRHRPMLALLERIRAGLGGRPQRLNSGHRCSVHNARIGGAPLSQHLELAGDLSTVGQDRMAVYRAAVAAGARGIGFYATFLHVDMGRRRRWYGSKAAKAIWQPLLAAEAAS